MASKILAVRSDDAVNTLEPSGEKTAASTEWSCPKKTCSHCSLSTSKRRAVPSPEAVSTFRPSGEKLAENITLLCPVKVRMQIPVSASNIFADLSSEAVSTQRGGPLSTEISAPSPSPAASAVSNLAKLRPPKRSSRRPGLTTAVPAAFSAIASSTLENSAGPRTSSSRSSTLATAWPENQRATTEKFKAMSSDASAAFVKPTPPAGTRSPSVPSQPRL
mmetsp:Transcript_90622/g.194320  ORF Transcript_90622/g.194320 Transcript_90622/m.194320 type:complete len:219 (+) Transcript_90622:151-807(+)